MVSVGGNGDDVHFERGGIKGVVGGASGGYLPPVCYGCGASGHIQQFARTNEDRARDSKSLVPLKSGALIAC